MGPKKTTAGYASEFDKMLRDIREKHHPGEMIAEDFEDGFVPFLNNNGDMMEPEAEDFFDDEY